MGGGADLFISNNSDKYCESYSNLTNSYQGLEGYEKESGFVKSYLAGSEKF
jgi:hypothetical protein